MKWLLTGSSAESGSPEILCTSVKIRRWLRFFERCVEELVGRIFVQSVEAAARAGHYTGIYSRF